MGGSHVERDPVDAAVTGLAREEGGRVLALLTRRYGDLDVADDAVQDALIEASTHWTPDTIPTNPTGWLMAVANRKAIDSIRRANSRDRRLRLVASDLQQQASEQRDAVRKGGEELVIESELQIDDDRLRLMFLCCHPAIDRDAQVALTLRLVGGLTTGEIAAGFLVPESTLAQRIVRAKRKIREARIPMTIPAAVDERLDTIMAVLYLTFNEGYLSRTGDAGTLQRIDLADEAIRITSVLAELCPGHPEVAGLLALELYQRARADARVDHAGDLVLLEDQDRSRWDRFAIDRANEVLRTAVARFEPGTYQLQALIAAKHANARTADDTDWPSIAAMYRQLVAMEPSPVLQLNHAVAVAMADGPIVGLALIDAIHGLDDYHLLHAARADLLMRLNRLDESASAYRRAIQLTDNPAEVRYLQRRLAAIEG